MTCFLTLETLLIKIIVVVVVIIIITYGQLLVLAEFESKVRIICFYTVYRHNSLKILHREVAFNSLL
jgi:hypothetical protein